jgi:hypothetical protein
MRVEVCKETVTVLKDITLHLSKEEATILRELTGKIAGSEPSNTVWFSHSGNGTGCTFSKPVRPLTDAIYHELSTALLNASKV